ncbi:hypothetical protein V1478_003868 [Vespula squamosa]|uniref:Uncharacterized protein n=1 Tax=Vespula squamosa TaxID=30214 RepID=A0ABD2BNL8_VESSQ
MDSFAAKRLKMSEPKLSEESSSIAQKISKNIEFFISDYANIFHYVDKTLLIKAVKKDIEMVLISGSRSFCKSANMGVLKKFVEREMDNNGQRIELQKG